MTRVGKAAANVLLGCALVGALVLAPGTAHAAAHEDARSDPPPGSSTPIGPAVYPGDPVRARFLGDQVRIRSYPDTADGRVLSMGRRTDRVDAHCYRTMRTSAAGGSATWIYISHRQVSGDDLQGWVNSRYLLAKRSLPRCSPGV